MDIRALGYLRLETTTLDEWRRYALDILGMVEATGTTEDTLCLRLDDRAHRIVIQAGEATASSRPAGRWRTPPRSPAPPRSWRRRRRRQGRRPAELAERRVQGLIHVTDPGGNPWRSTGARPRTTARSAPRTATASSPGPPRGRTSASATSSSRCRTSRPRSTSTRTCSASSCATR
ncbi:hypothetical protein O1L60_36530 [Streptomyces diastatochromogenes]|nr:hypothetical protein [Streptomyces diastatochromogenes]